VTGRLHGATGVFGGTFDPIHIAHLAVAEAARDVFGLRRVLFIPAAQPPHKPGRPITAVEHRLAMVEAAIAGNAGFKISRIEVDRPGPSYTVDTLEALRQADPGGHLALILSAESFAELPTWHRPERILELADLLVAPRDGFSAADRDEPLARARAVFLDGPRIRLSASEIRERAAAGRSIRYLVPDAVAAYIGDHDLYQDQRRDHRS
jgi:nicotinate-nucleotide adenylyltransferase